MAARDRYTKKTECKNCGTKGILHISEDDYPFMRKLNREIDEVEGDFSAKIRGDSDIEITCNACGNSFVVSY